MKTLFAIMLCTVAGCASAQAAVRPGEAAAIHAHVVAMQGTAPSVKPVDPAAPRCNGTGRITHGDGHTTPCPGCVDCENKASLIESIDEPLIQPAVYERITKVSRLQCADGECAAPTAPAADCECVQATGSCACAPAAKRATASGSCASGSCGSSASESRGPVRKFIKARPVRRLFGRLFGRR